MQYSALIRESEEMESEQQATDRTGTIGIIGAGNIGQALARTALRAGRKVVIANSRGPESLAPVVAALGAGVSAGTVPEAAAAGIVAIDVGDLVTGGRMQQPGGPLPAQNLVRLPPPR